MPHALALCPDSRITGYDPSRAQRDDGTPGTGWVWCSPEQYAAAKAMQRPTWVSGEPVDVPAPEVVPPATSSGVLALREAYREATRALCQIAGVTPVDKLEDVAYQQVAPAAYAANPAMAAYLTDTLIYALSTLRLDDGRDAWDRI